jgi:glycyl-tRNA synthetase beta chain
MGSYYAKHDGENPEIVAACAEHYLPRFGGDRLPSSRVGLVLALADKLETIVGIWGIGLAPTGEKDPFALRRHALGVCRLIIENDLPINLIPLLEQVKKQFDFAEVQHNADLSHILQFIKDRLRAYVREFEHTTFSTEEIEAVLANVTGQFKSIPQKLLAVHSFQELPQAGILAAANKRINNILKKNAHDPMRQIDQQLLELPAEKNLFAAMQALVPRLDAALLQQDFAASLHSLIEVCEPVEVFFKDVMVIDPDPLKRENRLAILHQLHQQFNQVADLSQLAQ